MKAREGEAPAEQFGGKVLVQDGSAGASPSRILSQLLFVRLDSEISSGMSRQDIGPLLEQKVPTRSLRTK